MCINCAEIFVTDPFLNSTLIVKGLYKLSATMMKLILLGHM